MRRNDTPAWDVVGKYATDVLTDEAVRLISEQPADKPMFMYLAHVAVHSGNRGKVLEAPQSEINKFNHILDPNRRTYAGKSTLFRVQISITVLISTCIRVPCSNGIQTRRIRWPSGAGTETEKNVAEHHYRIHVGQRITVIRRFWQKVFSQRRYYAQLGFQLSVQRSKYT